MSQRVAIFCDAPTPTECKEFFVRGSTASMFDNAKRFGWVGYKEKFYKKYLHYCPKHKNTKPPIGTIFSPDAEWVKL